MGGGISILNIFFNNFVKKFRKFNNDEFLIKISGLKNFFNENDKSLTFLFDKLKDNNLTIEFEGYEESINEINVTCNNITKNSTFKFKYQIQNLPTLIELSSKTDIHLVGIIITKIIAQIINKLKVLYKAIILDLDDTLWKGTLSEDGIEKIRENMFSEMGIPFIEFMKFVRTLGSDLGIFIAICSRNDSKLVEAIIYKLENNIFPLKNHIDLIIANNNDKSENIRIIAEKLSILPSSVVFIDDNQIVRDEVKRKLPEVFVLEWSNHNELITKLITSCVFERNELSLNSQNRRNQFTIIQAERIQNSLPKLFIKTNNDERHCKSIELFSKSNQFKFSLKDDNFSDDACSLYFEIIRENGENLGICSAITYSQSLNRFHIHNWALSCRYFEMGLEEYFLLYIYRLANQKELLIDYTETNYNQKVSELLNKYSDVFKYNCEYNQFEIILTNDSVYKINQNTNLENL